MTTSSRSFDDVQVRHLRALVAVAEEGSFRGAGHLLGYSQSAISQQVAGLERAVGMAVFDRPGGPRPPTLTPAGRLLLRHATAVLDRLAAAAEEVEQLRQGTSGRLVIGTFQSVSVQLLPELLGRLRADVPGLDVRLFEEEVVDLVDRVAADELDLAFVVGPVDDSRVEHVLVRQDPLRVVVPLAWADPGARSFPLDELRGRPMIGQSVMDSYQRRIDAALQAAGVDPAYVFRTNDNGAVQAMVRAGIGASVMPELAVDLDDDGVRVLAPEPALPLRDVELVWRRGRTQSAAARRFVELAASAVGGTPGATDVTE
ncbi:LysR family transcriptional regulator [Aquipuribacter nitratireducens]|uniref:LysR family transcriptional regulator n=1 Tax=Aquipuribacter nitratireducens TaxID=650104 RepID=A0ABW0GPJ2_9MICO